jgi:oligopeptidase B
VHSHHGVERPDPWFGLRDRDDPAVRRWLEEENAWTAERTSHLAPLRDRLFHEILGRIQEDDTSVPAQDGAWWYLTRTKAGQPYPIHLRRRGGPQGQEEVVLDENELAEGHDFLDVGAVAVSPSHRWLAYAVDHEGGEVYDLRFRDLETGSDLGDTLSGVGAAVAWAQDDQTLLYTRLDDTLRPWQVWRHRLGEPSDHDALVYQEDDPTFRVGVGATRDDRWLQIVTAASDTTEVYLLAADAPASKLRRVAARHPGHEYSVESQGDRLLILTNDSDDAHGAHDDGALTFALKTAPGPDVERQGWRTLIPARPDVTLEGVDAFADFFVVLERQQGLVHARVVGDREGIDHRVTIDEASWSLWAGENAMFHTRTWRLGFSSLRTPATVATWDIDAQRLTVLKRQPVRGGYDPRLYVVRRLHAAAPDGVAVPVSLVHRRDLKLDGARPTLLYGYGAYGISMDPTFSSARLSLLDRGMVFAIAHVRGGADLGRAWYEQGKLEHKAHSFQDLLAAAHALREAGVCGPEQLAIEGGSAGGLLVGATLNLAPDAFRCAIAEVPFVDVLNTMLDPTLPLTTNEYAEWGNPEERPFFDLIRQYAPYENVAEARYPALFVTAGLNDPRVPYWEPAKWVARLRERTLDPRVLLFTWMGAGHAGNSGRYGWITDQAMTWAWMLDQLGLGDVSPGGRRPKSPLQAPSEAPPG